MRIVVAILGLLLGFPCVAQEAQEDLFPLAVGNEWVYSIGKGELRVVVKEKRVPRDMTVECWKVDTYDRGMAPLQMEYYAMEGGRLLLYRRAQPGISMDLTPASPYLDLPLAEGKTWTWKGNFGPTEAIGTFEVEAFESVTVIAGTFQAWRVHYEWELADGTRIQSRRWFSPGVGMVRQADIIKVGHNTEERIGELKSYKLAGR